MGESFRDVHDTYTKTFGKRTRISSVFGQQTFLVVKEMPRKREPSFRKRLASYFRVMDVKEGEVLKTPEEPEQIIAKLSPKTEHLREIILEEMYGLHQHITYLPINDEVWSTTQKHGCDVRV